MGSGLVMYILQGNSEVGLANVLPFSKADTNDKSLSCNQLTFNDHSLHCNRADTKDHSLISSGH